MITQTLGSEAAAGVRAPARRYTVETVDDWSAVAGTWSHAATPFQDAAWLGAWYDALRDRPGLSPLLVTVREAGTGALAMRLPLVVQSTGRGRIITFADLELTDYNAPVLGPAAPEDEAGARALWRAVRRALPSADLVRLAKMPPTLRGRPNPLTLLPAAQPCAVNGNIVRTGDDWDGWRRSLEKTVRKELERSWRVFTREPDARFEIVTDREQAQRIVDAMERQQETRMQEKGVEFVLDDPDFARFYRTLIDRSLDSGYVLVSALMAGDEVVASLVGIRDEDSYVMVRIANAGGRWTTCSPGRLVIERTMAALHAEGCRAFDFSVGNYDYKRRFGVEPLPLSNLTQWLGWRGLPAAIRAAAAGALRRRPEHDRRVRAVASRVGARLRRSAAGTSAGA